MKNIRNTVFVVVLFLVALWAPSLSFAQAISGPESLKYKTRWGENLTRISERYGLTVDEIVVANTGNGCIKTRDLVLAMCKISIPLKEIPQVKASEENHVRVEQGLAKTALKATREFEQEQRRAWTIAAVASVLLVALIFGVLQLSRRDEKLIELKEQNEELGKQLWVIEDRLKLTPGNFLELRSQNNGIIKFPIKALTEEGVELGCPVAECLANTSGANRLHKDKALHHYFNNHGTTEKTRPNGFGQ